MTETFTGVCTGHGAGMPPCERHHPGGYADRFYRRQKAPQAARHAQNPNERYARIMKRARQVLAADAKTRREHGRDTLAQPPAQPTLGLRR